MRPMGAHFAAILGITGEIECVLKRTAVVETLPPAPFPAWRGRLAGHDVLIVSCLAGKVNAAMTAQALIEHCRPRLILCVGSAGSLMEEVLPGDIVVSEFAFQHDAGLNLGRRFIPLGVYVSQDGRNGLRKAFRASSDIMEAARAAASALPRGGEGRPPKVYFGGIASGDQIIFSKERAHAIRSDGALAVDMESAAVAQVAEANEIPWLAIRGISDPADEKHGLNLRSFLDEIDADRSALAWLGRQGDRLWYFARHPRAPARAVRLALGTRRAAERAAGFCEETLLHWRPEPAVLEERNSTSKGPRDPIQNSQEVKR